MCVRTYLLPTSPEFKKKDKGPANPKRKKKVPNDLPSVFQLGSDQQWHFAEYKKKRTLEPFEDFPAFLVDLQVACLQTKGDPGSLILWSFFLSCLGIWRATF